MQRITFFLCVMFFAASLMAADGQWGSTADGSWSDPANWNGGIIASGSTYTATFDTTGSGAITVNNDLVSLPLGGILLAGGGFILTGNGLLLDAGGSIQVTNSNHTVNMPVVLQGDMDYAIGSGLSLDQGGAISGDGGVALTGGILTLSAAANTYTGKTTFTKGTLKFSDPDQLGTSGDSELNLVLGDGTLHYTGSGDVMTRGLTMDAAPGLNNKASAIRVDGDLEISGKMNSASGAFIKTGPGTLTVSYPGDHQLARNRSGVNEGANLTYDADGSAGSLGYAYFTVEDGRMVVSGPDQIARFNGTAFIGARSPHSPEFVVSGSTVYSTASWWTIGRGTGTTGTPQSPSMSLLDGAYMNIQGSGLVMGNANGSGDYLCYPKLLVDNSHLKVNNSSFISENSNAHATIVVTNNAHYESSSEANDRGIELSRSGGNTVMTVTDNSTLTAHYLAVKANADLIVENGSEAKLHLTQTWMGGATSGDVFFDNATLMAKNPVLAPNWFLDMDDLNVRSCDMTIEVDKYAFLDPVLVEDPADLGGQAIKTGVGQLALRMPEADVDVQAGSLAFPCDDELVQSKTTGALTFGAGTAMGASGQRALTGLSVPAGTTMNLTPHSLTQFRRLWYLNDDAKWRNDGCIHLCGNNTDRKGNAFLTTKYDMSGPWTVEFSYSGYSTGGNPADGVCFIIHNDADGLDAIGDLGGAMAYTGVTSITNSIGVGLDVYNKKIRLGVGGTWVDSVDFPAGMPHLTLMDGKVKCTVEYDGSGTMDVRIENPQFGFVAGTFSVDVVAAIKADTGYVGFGAATGGAAGQHFVSDVSIDNGFAGVLPDYCWIDGGATLGAAETLAANLTASQEQQGYLMDSLAYADQSVLEINSQSVDNTAPELGLDDQDAWKLMGAAYWLGDGRVATSTNVNDGRGAAYCYNSYDLLSRSWEMKFSYDMGIKDATAADAFEVVFMYNHPDTLGSYYPPGDACRFEWRYYEGTQRQTQLKVSTNSVKTIAVLDLSPVDLQADLTADVTISYDRPTDTVTIRTESPGGVYTHVMNNFNLPKALRYTDMYIGFYGNVGGLQCENIIGDLSLTYTDGGADGNGETHYLSFNELSGSGTLLKTGSGALGISGDIDSDTSNASVEVQEGSILLAKRSLEPAALGGAVRSDWVSANLGVWGKDGSFQVCPYGNTVASTAHYSRRICVSKAWTIEYDFFMDDKSGSPADAYSIFMHNDPRGIMALGAATGNAGYAGTGSIQNSIAIRWYFYQGNSTLLNTSEFGRNGGFIGTTRQKYDPIRLASGITHHTISYDPGTQVLQSVLSNGGSVVTNTFTGVDIATDVGDDFAWLGFGGGTGGQFADMCVNNLSMTYQEDLPDANADTPYLGELVVPAGVEAPVYLQRPVDQELDYTLASVEVGDGGTLKVGYAPGSVLTRPASLVADEMTLSGVGSVEVEGNAIYVVELSTGDSLRKFGEGTLEIARTSGTPAAYTGGTILEAGTILMNGAYLPETTALAVTNGATLSMQFSGKQYVDTLTVDGIQKPGGLYSSSNTAWIEGTGILIVRNPASGTVILVR